MPTTGSVTHKVTHRVLQPGTYRYTLFVLVLSLLAIMICATGGAAYLIKRQDDKVADAKKQVEMEERERDQEWCALLSSIGRPPEPGVTLNDRQRETIKLIQELAADKGCPVPSGQ